MNPRSPLLAGGRRFSRVRPAAQAGRFYPADPATLRREVSAYIRQAEPSPGPDPKAIIVPHAGYGFSGPVAGSGYAAVAAARRPIRLVVLIGPAHYREVEGLAFTRADAFATPLGAVPVDAAARERLAAFPEVQVDDQAHWPEHCLEVQLPFLQAVLGDFAVVPLLVGSAADQAIARILEELWGGPETLIVVSSDLSHYHDYGTAQSLDARTAAAIVALRGTALVGHDACGYRPIRGLLDLAGTRGLTCRQLDLRNSGDTAGPRDRVVGYGAFALA